MQYKEKSKEICSFSPVRTIFTNLLIREDSLKCVFEDLFSTHFLFERKHHEFIIINTQLLLCHCWGLYLQIFIQLIHQASEELISILLFSYIQLPVPHLKNLQHTTFTVRQQASGFLTASNRRIVFFQFPTSSYLPEVLRYVVLQLALHQVTKQRLDLVEDTVFWLVSVILNGEEGLKLNGI